MQDIQKHKVVPYTPHQIYELVNNIEAYPTFLKWCKDTRVISLSKKRLRATLWIEYLSYTYPFTTENTLTQDKAIILQLFEGPFRSLEGAWRFKKIKEGCLINFQLHYEFSTALLGTLLSPIFEQIAKNMVEAFVKEADRRYKAGSNSQ